MLRLSCLLMLAALAVDPAIAQTPRTGTAQPPTSAAPAVLAPEPGAVDVPLFHPVAQFGVYGVQNAPVEATLTAAEETALVAALRAQERFPRYLYSGCHDRAHAAWMLLPAPLRSKLMKVWAVAPARYTAALPGTIGLRGEGPALAAVGWGYHVALAWRGPSGLRIYDAVLQPDRALSTDGWFALMTIPRLTLWTLTRGDLYNFNFSKLDPALGKRTFVWNGNAFNYDGGARAEQWIPNNIARDAVGIDATAGTTCPTLTALATDPEALLAYLRAGQAAATAACRPSVGKFEAERTRWSAKLGS